jgi:hypothetical protein
MKSKNEIEREALQARLERGEKTAAHQVVRMTREGRSGEGKVRQSVVRTGKQWEAGKCTAEQARARLLGLRRKCTEAGWTVPPEIEELLGRIPAPGGGLDSTEAQRRGGQAKTPAKLAALEALHEARRGVRVHPLPAKVSAALVAARLLLDKYAPRGPSKPLGTSMKAFAADIGVASRTVGRWLSGEDFPAPTYHRAILEWLAGMRLMAKALDAKAKAGDDG